jgi:Domain of unknown function (DUF4365)
MAKVVRDTHITGEAGVIAFAKYCNEHRPYIIFREITKNDFGIDGEIELTRTNQEGKREPTAEVLRIQIKTTNSDNSYIKNETDTSFEFFPEKDDIEYWSKYKRYNQDVLLVIYDNRYQKLYCKKITDIDLHSGKLNEKKNKRLPITYDKTENLLNSEASNFVQKYSSSFRSRVNFDIKEILSTNFFPFAHYPKVVYAYKAKYKSKRQIYEHIQQPDAPFFVVYDSIIYTFNDLSGQSFSKFKTEILAEAKGETISYNKILLDKDLKRHYVELLSDCFRTLLWDKGLTFSKDYSRFYFRKKRDENLVEVPARTRKRDRETNKKVVTYHSYGKNSFYRHIAVELKTIFIEEKPYLIIIPKYFFTKDGKEPLEPKLITRFTNYLTAREYNNHYLDWLHFWKSYFFRSEREWTLVDYNKVKIILKQYEQFEVPFGIATDYVKERKKKMVQEPREKQKTLFENES